MNTVPNMISTKDLSYLSDVFEWNFNACKELKEHSCNCQIDEVKQILSEASTIHKNICQKIIGILGGNYE